VVNKISPIEPLLLRQTNSVMQAITEWTLAIVNFSAVYFHGHFIAWSALNKSLFSNCTGPSCTNVRAACKAINADVLPLLPARIAATVA
jgi:hypothetical protein